jgi:hypothetical protein
MDHPKSTEKQLESRFKVAVFGVILIFLVAMPMSIVSLVTSDRVSSNAARIELESIAQCERVNTLRKTANNNSKIIHDVLGGAAISQHREAILAKANHDMREYKLHMKTSRLFVRLANKSQHTALTDCKAVVADPAHYKTPGPMKYPKVKLPK